MLNTKLSKSLLIVILLSLLGFYCDARQNPIEKSVRLLRVSFIDHKVKDGYPTFVIKYLFEEIGLIEVRCDDTKAMSKLKSKKLFSNQILQSFDFYCFDFYSLVEDLQDVTNGYSMPSFSSNSFPPLASFDFEENPRPVIDLKFNSKRIDIISRKSEKILMTFLKNEN